MQQSLAPTIVGGRLDYYSDSEIRWNAHQHYSIGLYDGEQWQLVTPSGLVQGFIDSTTISGSALTNGNYDVYAKYLSQDNLELIWQEWSGDNSRYETPQRFDGVLVRDLTTEGKQMRFLGIIRVDESGNFIDTNIKRFVFNYYNKKLKTVYARPSDTGSWSYSGGAWVTWNNGSNYYAAYCLCHEPEDILMSACGEGTSSASSNAKTYLGTSLNGTVHHPYSYKDADATNDNHMLGCAAVGTTIEGLNQFDIKYNAADGTPLYEGGYAYHGCVAEIYC